MLNGFSDKENSKSIYFYLLILAFLFISWNIIWNTSHNSSSLPLNYGFAETILTNNLEQCYEKIDPHTKIRKGATCYDYTRNNVWLKCHFGIPPNDTKSYVLVVGSANPAARLFTNILKTNNIPFCEIMSKLQFDINQSFHRFIIQNTNIRYIIDFSYHNTKSLLTDIAHQKNIPVFHIVSHQINENGVYELVVPQIFGPLYIDANTINFFRQVMSKIDGKNETYDYEPLDAFASGSEIASFLYEYVLK